MTESTGEKAVRLLAEGRLCVVRADPSSVEATCTGDNGTYHLGFDDHVGEWWCGCPAYGPGCSHLKALRLVLGPVGVPL